MSETPEQSRTSIEAWGLKVGNVVRALTGLNVGANLQLSTDTNSLLQATVPTTVVQPTITGEIVKATGTGAAGILTQTLVAGGDVTTFTKTGFIRVQIVDSGGAVTNGFHYIQIGTLT